MSDESRWHESEAMFDLFVSSMCYRTSEKGAKVEEPEF